MVPSKLAFLALFVSVMESVHEIGAIPHPSFKDFRFVDSAHAPLQMHDVEKPLAEKFLSSLQGALEGGQFHDRRIHESIPFQDDPASLVGK
jgi:hypothetical protein